MKVGKVVRVIAVGLYLAVTRVLLTLAFVVPCLFFILNSSPFPGILSNALRAVLPGTLEFRSIQTSPLPWRVGVLGVTIRRPDGEVVVSAGAVRARVDLIPLFKFLLGRTNNELHLHFPRAQVADYDVRLFFDDEMHFQFLDAFVPPDDGDDLPEEPPKAGGVKVRLTFDDIRTVDGKVFLRFPDWDVNLENVEVSGRLWIRPGAGVRVESDSVSFQSGKARVRVLPESDVVPRDIVVNRGSVKGFFYDVDRIGFDGVVLDLEGMNLDVEDGRLAWTPPLTYEGSAFFEIPEGSPILATLSSGAVQGPIQIRVSGRGDILDPRLAMDLASPGLRINQHALGPISLSLNGGRDVTGSWALSGIVGSVRTDAGSLQVRDGTLHPFGIGEGSTLDAVARIDARAFDLGVLMDAFGVGLPGPPIPIPSLLDADIQARVTLLEGQGLQGFLDVSGTAGGPLPPGTLMAGQDIQARIDARATFEGETNRPGILLRDLQVRSGPDLLRLKGTFSFLDDTVRLEGSIQKDIGSALAAFGVPGAGTLSIPDLRVRGAPLRMEARAGLTATDVNVADWTADSLNAELSWREGTLSLGNLLAHAPYGEVKVERLDLRLLTPDGRALPSPRLALEMVDARRVDLEMLPPLAGLGIKGRGEAAVESLELDLASPLRTLEGRGRVQFPLVTAAGRAFRSVSAVFTLDRGVLGLDPARVALVGGGNVEVSGTFNLETFHMDATASGRKISLAALAGMNDETLSGSIDVDAKAEGTLADPVLSGTVTVDGLTYADFRASTIEVDFEREAGQDLRLSSDRFLPKVRLNPRSGILWEGGRFTGLVAMVDINRMTPQEIVPSLRARDLWARLTGHIELRMGFSPGSGIEAVLVSPPEGLILGFFNREILVKNEDRLEISLRPDGSVLVTGLSLNDGRGRLEACGQVRDSKGDAFLLLRGDLGAYWLRALKGVFSTADGYVKLTGDRTGVRVSPPPGCPTDIDASSFLRITGNLPGSPAASGDIEFGKVTLGLRRIADLIQFQPGGFLKVRTTSAGNLRMEIPQQQAIRGMFGEGNFGLSGSLDFQGLTPDAGELDFAGVGLRFVSPGAFYLVGNPTIRARFLGLSRTGKSDVTLSGNFLVTEGAYHKNFDLVRRTFSGVAGRRVAERQGPPLETMLPWLADAKLDVGVVIPRFGVRSKLLVGTTDFDLSANLHVRGTVRYPELWNRVEILPGGRMTYDLVRREFEVVRGTLDFIGEPLRPIVDLTARTRMEVSGGSADAVVAGSRFAPEDTGFGSFEDEGVLVTLRVDGRYPDLDISLSSNSKGLTQTDLQFLLLTGTLPNEGGAGMAGTFNLGLLTEDVTNLMTKALLGSFVDTVNFGVSPSGGVNVDVMAHLGSRLRFQTQILQQQGVSRYSAGFFLRLTDRLSLQGRVRAVERALESSDEGRVYETKLRYRIPID
jgi:hypothetical protein